MFLIEQKIFIQPTFWNNITTHRCLSSVKYKRKGEKAAVELKSKGNHMLYGTRLRAKMAGERHGMDAPLSSIRDRPLYPGNEWNGVHAIVHKIRISSACATTRSRFRRMFGRVRARGGINLSIYYRYIDIYQARCFEISTRSSRFVTPRAVIGCVSVACSSYTSPVSGVAGCVKHNLTSIFLMD